MADGYVSLILHAHLPYVRHPERESYLEESWLFEAITETYIPLLDTFEQLQEDGVDFRLTVSLSPTLISMLQDDLLQRRYLEHMERMTGLAEKEMEHLDDGHMQYLARTYRDRFREAARTFDEKYGRDLVRGFRRFQEAGKLEIMICAATHGFLPLLKPEPAAVRAQLQVAARTYRETFGREPAGVWLPECGYYPGLEEYVHDAGFKYFILESHGIENASVRPHYGLMAPLACPNGVAAFGRDRESSEQVWSGELGYPGDPDYREFHWDIGFAREQDYLQPYMPGDDVRLMTGLKYYRVTGETHEKDLYHPEDADEKAATHAGHFMFCREKQVEHHAAHMDRPPMVVAPYDAELFGHWWHEGPRWLEHLVRKITFDQNTVAMATPSDYLERHPVLQQATPGASSWGHEGYNEFWLNGGNDWVYPHLHAATRRMRRMVRGADPATEREERALNQAARSLLLAQASDWTFIMKTGTSVECARQHIRQHLARFNWLEKAFKAEHIDEKKLQAIEIMDNIFPSMDYRVFQ